MSCTTLTGGELLKFKCEVTVECRNSPGHGSMRSLEGGQVLGCAENEEWYGPRRIKTKGF